MATVRYKGTNQLSHNGHPMSGTAASNFNNYADVHNENMAVGEASPSYPLKYQGMFSYVSNVNFRLTNTGCYVCQVNFNEMRDFDDHMGKHETAQQCNEFLIRMEPIFSVSYKLCKNSYKLRFIIKRTTKPSAILPNPEILKLDTVIFVRSRQMFSMKVQEPDNIYDPEGGDFIICGICHMDSYPFTPYDEHPIILVADYKIEMEGAAAFEPTIRLIEQHILLHDGTLPVVKFCSQPGRLPKYFKFKPNFKLPKYNPPQCVVEALRQDSYCDQLCKLSRDFREYLRNKKTLTLSTYVPCLKLLLQIEDTDTISEYEAFFQDSVEISYINDEYSFQVNIGSGVYFENVVSPCDHIYLKRLSGQLESERRCFITNIYFNRVEFKCETGSILIYNYDGDKIKYSARFQPARASIRSQYKALELLSIHMPILQKFLFPTNVHPRPPAKLNLKLLNENIYKNPEQLEAVCNIVQGQNNEAPYVIFGPPGTGKTTTIVEAILQLLITNDASQILVTAPANSACDEVALRLCKYLEPLNIRCAITRIYSRSNEDRADHIDDILLECSNIYDTYFLPSVDVLHNYRVVVCTLGMVAKLSTGGFGKVFSHVFIDEVAACTEAEALLGIVGILRNDSHLIISGDHKQLGPILKSTRSEELGLNVSLLERLMNRECYRVDADTGYYNRSVQTRLRLNFRSHPEIVKLFSGLFYNHALEAASNYDEHNWLDKWDKLRNKYPIIFHSTKGICKRHEQSVSLYNTDEVDVVMDYVNELMQIGVDGVTIQQTDIGVISPYKRQYRCIQEELNLRKWFHIEVGSVETFQGREKRIMIVSFVRSNISKLGFLTNPRRINVTLSRPKSLLILIGNAETLGRHGIFAHIIETCRLNGTLCGTDVTTENTERSYTKAVENLSLNDDNVQQQHYFASNTRRKYQFQNNNGHNIIGQPGGTTTLNNNGSPMNQNIRRSYFKSYRRINTSHNDNHNTNNNITDESNRNNGNEANMTLTNNDDLPCVSNVNYPSWLSNVEPNDPAKGAIRKIPRTTNETPAVTGATGATATGATATTVNHLNYDTSKLFHDEMGSYSHQLLNNSEVVPSEYQWNYGPPNHDYLGGIYQNPSTGLDQFNYHNNHYSSTLSASTSGNRSYISSPRREELMEPHASVRMMEPQFQVNCTNDTSAEQETEFCQPDKEFCKPYKGFYKPDNCSIC